MNFKYFALVGAFLSVACFAAKTRQAPETLVVAEEVVVGTQNMGSMSDAGAECLPMHKPYFKPIKKTIIRKEHMPAKCVEVTRLVEEKDVYEVLDHEIDTYTVCDENGCREGCPPKRCPSKCEPCAPRCPKRVCNPCRTCK